MTQKFRGKRKILGNPFTTPFVFFLFRLSPAYFLYDKTQKELVLSGLCGFSACMYLLTHTRIYTEE